MYSNTKSKPWRQSSKCSNHRFNSDAQVLFTFYTQNVTILLIIPHTAISHGDTVAFQPSCNPSNWLSCWTNPCTVAGNCPGTNHWGCWGEVFELYRQSGPGTFCVGDMVGIHYPHQSGWWLGCPGGTDCGKFDCPGTPTSTYGFKDSSTWDACWGEVFHIYAMGKSFGNPIIEGDIVMLYQPNVKKWVALSGGRVPLSTCPGLGHPPPLSKYESCSEATMKILKK